MASICEQCRREHVPVGGGRPCLGHLGKNSADPGAPCSKRAMRGQDVCGTHGGRAKQNKAAGERRHAGQRAEAAMRRFGEPIDTTPSEALLDTVKWTAGYVGWIREKVAETKNDYALTQRSTQTGKREPSVWVELLGTWSDRLVKVCEAAIRAGIEERRVRIAEQQGALVADVIRKILGDLELTPEQASKAGEAVPRHLRLLAG